MQDTLDEENDLEQLLILFFQLDKDGKCIIDKQELEKACKEKQISSEELQVI